MKVVKDGAPKVIKFLPEEISLDVNEITADTVHSIEFNLEEESSITIVSALNQARRLQDLFINMWVSKTPYGLVLPREWKNLSIISLLTDPTIINVIDKKYRPIPENKALVILEPGIYYINLHNRSGGIGYYHFRLNVHKKY